MLQRVYFRDTINANTFTPIDFLTLKKMENTANHKDFLRIKENLFRDENNNIPMVIVRNGNHQGFRRKGNIDETLYPKTRGENESVSHSGNKEVIANMKIIPLIIGDETVTLYIDKAETEERIIFGNHEYRVDIYLTLSKTEPKEYFELLGHELWFEIFDTCKVDAQQAEDFSIANKSLFEYKVPQNCKFYSNLTEEQYEKRKKSLFERYFAYGIRGCLISKNNGPSPYKWHLSQKNHLTTKMDNYQVTLLKSNFSPNTYGIRIDDEKPIYNYNGLKDFSIEQAKKIAEYLCFSRLNLRKD